MMLTIAILSAIGYILSIVNKAFNGQIGVNVFLAAILVISAWQCIAISIIAIVITVIICLLGIFLNEN